METHTTLTEKITRILLEEISTGKYKDEQRLPPEKEVALSYKVSRSVVREALFVLEREGFISRKHGIGTIINHHVLNIQNRMDLEQEFCEEIRASGYHAARKPLGMHIIPATAQIANKLHIESCAQLLSVSCLIYADEKPAIYATDYIPQSLLVRTDYKLSDFEKPIFDFLQVFCDTDIHMSTTEVHAIAADATIAKALDLAFATPVLNLNELGYTFFGKPVMYSEEYYVDGLLTQTLLRKKV